MIPSNLRLAIVAPGGYAPDGEALGRAIAKLQSQGCVVHSYYHHEATFQRFGGTDAARLAQLHDAARDPEVDVVMALRGQYGISRILDRIDFDLLAGSGKIFCGYSDITALHMGLLARGVCSYAGPMFYGDFTPEPPDAFTLGDFVRCLRGPTHTVEGGEAGNPSDVAVSGPVWGGNLSMLVHLLGTPFFPQVDGGILFIEDVNEHPYRIERMLLQLLNAGVLARQRALLIGSVSKYKLAPTDRGYDYAAMLSYLRERLPLPVLTGLPFGHVPTRATIPVGAHGQLECDGDAFILTLSGYPTLPDA